MKNFFRLRSETNGECVKRADFQAISTERAGYYGVLQSLSIHVPTRGTDVVCYSKKIDCTRLNTVAFFS